MADVIMGASNETKRKTRKRETKETKMTKLYNVTIQEENRLMTYMELTESELFDKIAGKTVENIKELSYTQEDKLAHCERFGNN